MVFPLTQPSILNLKTLTISYLVHLWSCVTVSIMAGAISAKVELETDPTFERNIKRAKKHQIRKSYQRYEKVELGDGSSQGEGDHHHEIPESIDMWICFK